MTRKCVTRSVRLGSVVATAAVVALAISACAASSTGSRSPSTGVASGAGGSVPAPVPEVASPNRASTTPAAGASPSLRASAPAVESGVGVVTGVHPCAEIIEGTDTPVGAVVQRRGQIFRCTWDVSDPRLRGTGVSLISADIAGDGSAVVWARDVTWTEGGTWVGRATGTKDAVGVHWLTTSSFGTGAYAGLRYTDSESGPGDSWPVHGRIEPIQGGSSTTVTTEPGLSTPAGRGTCHEALAATAVGPSQLRAWLFDCDIVNVDPRVAGRQLVLVNADAYADGSADLGGVTILWNEQGTWDGSWTGKAGEGWPSGQRIWSGTLAGSGAYRGSAYHVVTTAPDGAVVIVNGSVTAAH